MELKKYKKWSVDYSHDDGRSGTVEVETKLFKSWKGDEEYGNKHYGILRVGEFKQLYDVRYCRCEDRNELHTVMLEEYFGEGLVKASEIEAKTELG